MRVPFYLVFAFHAFSPQSLVCAGTSIGELDTLGNARHLVHEREFDPIGHELPHVITADLGSVHGLDTNDGDVEELAAVARGDIDVSLGDGLGARSRAELLTHVDEAYAAVVDLQEDLEVLDLARGAAADLLQAEDLPRG